MTKSKKSRAKKRSASEMISAKNAEVAKLQNREAMEKAADNPQVKSLNVVLGDLTKQIIEFQKGFGKGPQSFANRILGKQVWIDVINAEAAFARIGLAGVQAQRDFLKTNIASLASAVVEGRKAAELKVLAETIVENIPTLDEGDMQDAKNALDAAVALREKFTKDKKMSAKQKKAQEAS